LIDERQSVKEPEISIGRRDGSGTIAGEVQRGRRRS
jgi:hypothetical protein